MRNRHTRGCANRRTQSNTDPWPSVMAFLLEMVTKGHIEASFAEGLPKAIKDNRKGHRYTVTTTLQVMDAFRRMQQPRLVINWFLFLFAGKLVDDRCWILFVSALSATTGARYTPSNSHLALWSIRQTTGTIARRYPFLYSMCLNVCMSEMCPRRVVIILRYMQHDRTLNNHILCRVLLWCLHIQHFECARCVLRMMRREAVTIERIIFYDILPIWKGRVQQAPRIVRQILTLARRLTHIP